MTKEVFVSTKQIASSRGLKEATVRELFRYFGINPSERAGATYLYRKEVIDKFFERLVDIKMSISQ